MDELSNRSSGASEEPMKDSSEPVNEKEGENRDENLEKNDVQKQLSSNNSDCTVENAERGESIAPQSVTLATAQLSESDLQFDEPLQLSEVPVEYSLQPLQSVQEHKDKVSAIHKEPSKGAAGPSSQLQRQQQKQLLDGPFRLELSPSSVIQNNSSISTPIQPERKLQLLTNGNRQQWLIEDDKQKSPGPKSSSSVSTPKTPSDGYNWRKYGQKQVKSPEGSRSYYRCTFSDCVAKKIECSDRFNRVIETVYRSHHNHDPPQKLNCNRENRPALPSPTVNKSADLTNPVRGLNYSREPLPGNDLIPEAKQESNDSDETTEINVKDEYVDGPEQKKRQKRLPTSDSGTLPKPGNKPKFVVHAAGDVGISGDGYRWRKYGQKMVKGNPHPRNYYRCTSAGCPVRKHIERAVDNTNAVIITYKGGHDHDKPVPRKRNGPKTGSPVPSTTAVIADNLETTNTNTLKSQSQLSVDKGGESTGEAVSPGRKKTSEAPRTLLSVGVDIKPC